MRNAAVFRGSELEACTCNGAAMVDTAARRFIIYTPKDKLLEDKLHHFHLELDSSLNVRHSIGSFALQCTCPLTPGEELAIHGALSGGRQVMRLTAES